MSFKFVGNCIKGGFPYGFCVSNKQRKRKKRILKSKKEAEFRLQKEQEIKNYFLSLDENAVDFEILEIINHFKTGGFSIFPYKFIKKYHASDIDVFFDKNAGMLYVMHENKRLYFPEGWKVDDVRNYYLGICVEQDENSPHRYETSKFSVKTGDVIADIGAAEGIWALSNVEKASKIYLFECEEQWIKALEMTFEPWKEKVVIVKKYVSNIVDKKNTTLDEWFNKKQSINFIKADIEGYEIKMFEGSKDTLKNNDDLKLLLCTYHKKDDAVNFKQTLENSGFTTEFSKGYMLFIIDNELSEPYVRRGVIRAQKDCK